MIKVSDDNVAHCIQNLLSGLHTELYKVKFLQRLLFTFVDFTDQDAPAKLTTFKNENISLCYNTTDYQQAYKYIQYTRNY